MKLAIADPPYPPQLTERYDTVDGRARIARRSRARRWYGDGSRDSLSRNRPADFHPDAGEWDDPARHRALLEQLLDEYDGWAIATSPDGLDCYRPLPIPCHTIVWRKLRPLPTAHRIATSWEPIIVYPPRNRRARPPARISGRVFGPQVPDVIEAAPPGNGFAGAKPRAWTLGVLDALGYDPRTDVVADLFPGSGSVSAVLAEFSTSEDAIADIAPGTTRSEVGDLAPSRRPPAA